MIDPEEIKSDKCPETRFKKRRKRDKALSSRISLIVHGPSYMIYQQERISFKKNNIS
jgi:hypothetical protein